VCSQSEQWTHTVRIANTLSFGFYRDVSTDTPWDRWYSFQFDADAAGGLFVNYNYKKDLYEGTEENIVETVGKRAPMYFQFKTDDSDDFHSFEIRDGDICRLHLQPLIMKHESNDFRHRIQHRIVYQGPDQKGTIGVDRHMYLLFQVKYSRCRGVQ